MRYAFFFFIAALGSFASCKKSDPVGTPTTPSAKLDTVMDIDGNVYRTVKIGNQVWMGENLRVTRYNNGDPIKNLKEKAEWANNLTEGAWCHYGNSSFLDTTYGKLYNWYAISDSRGIAPKGWHVATAEDFKTLIDSTGGIDSAGTHLKEASLFWQQPNIATNKSKFSARPGGSRVDYGDFEWYTINRQGIFWSLSPYDNYRALVLVLFNDQTKVIMGPANVRFGYSVRCVKNK
jgi:uncharacterized protein (TIGR02145 family)